DYRTNTTDEKLEEFRNQMGWLMVETQRHLGALGLLGKEPAAEERVKKSRAIIEENERLITIKAGETTVELLKDKGLALKSLVMDCVSDKALVGTLSHGFYEDIHYGADFFSGHLINVEKDGTKVCDLVSVDAEIEEFADKVRVSAVIPLKFGKLTKSYDISLEEPRVVLRYKLKVQALEASSLRLGIFTFNPDAFDKESLFFESTSGGDRAERFLCDNLNFDHGEPVSPTVSATNCAGATTGEITLGDKDKGLTITSNRAELYSVPFVKHSPVDDKYFFRLSHSIGERDETSYWTWRGLNTISFTITPFVKSK
ncbi:MAG: hypothetical protein IME98_02115, partial [Proteobacteria bacterium]|nr:hypothetical protein [Pseudomonadota bacterium]